MLVGFRHVSLMALRGALSAHSHETERQLAGTAPLSVLGFRFSTATFGNVARRFHYSDKRTAKLRHTSFDDAGYDSFDFAL
jgi:hypothetical protein